MGVRSGRQHTGGILGYETVVVDRVDEPFAGEQEAIAPARARGRVHSAATLHVRNEPDCVHSTFEDSVLGHVIVSTGLMLVLCSSLIRRWTPWCKGAVRRLTQLAHRLLTCTLSLCS